MEKEIKKLLEEIKDYACAGMTSDDCVYCREIWKKVKNELEKDR